MENMNAEMAKDRLLWQLSHPVDGLRYLQLMLSQKGSMSWQMKELVSMYDGVWEQAPPGMKANWAKNMWESRSLIASLQKQLGEGFPPLSSRPGEREAMAWRERLHHWIPDPQLKRDLLKIVQKSSQDEDVSHAVGLLYRMAGNGETLNQYRHEIRASLISRIYTTPVDGDALAAEKNATLLGVQARYESDPEKIDAVITQMVRDRILPLHSGTVQLLKDMYGRMRPVLRDGTPDKSRPVRTPDRFADEYREMREELPGLLGIRFPPLPAERLQHYRGQMVGVILERLTSSPSSVDQRQIRLLVEMMNGLPEKTRMAWQPHVDASVYNCMNRNDVDAQQQSLIYGFLAPEVTEKTQAAIWKGIIWRENMRRSGQPASEVGGTEKQADADSRRADCLLKCMVDSASLQFLVKMIGDDNVYRRLPAPARMAAMERLTDRTAELPWWKETPSRAMMNRLRTQMGEMGVSPDIRGVPYEEWEKYLAGLPATNHLNKNALLVNELLRQQDTDRERRILQRVNVQRPADILKDNDPLVFHLVPRLQGMHGQNYFGFLFEKLLISSAREPERYIAHMEDVAPFLDKPELLARLAKPEVMTAYLQSPELGVRVACHLNRIRPSADETQKVQIEELLGRIHLRLEGKGGPVGEEWRSSASQSFPVSAARRVDGGNRNLHPRPDYRPGGPQR